jgi:hypothetical protein
VTTGIESGSGKSEVIDVMNPSNICRPMVSAPYDRIHIAVGGLINNMDPMICNGYASNYGYLSECYLIGSRNNTFVPNSHPLSYKSASVVLNKDTLWITGGFHGDGYLKSSTQVHMITI